MKQPERIPVIFFQRKPRPGFNFSIESIFDSVRRELKNKIRYLVKYSGCFNDGYHSKFYNIIQAAFRQKKNTISHITGEVHFLNLFMRKKNVLLTIHDCRFVERKQGLQQKLIKWLYLKVPVAKAAYITTVSEVTKQDVMRHTGCNAEKITVVPVPVNVIFQPSARMFNKELPSILQMGTAPNKNFFNLIKALKDLPCKLVIVGVLDDEQFTQLKSSQIQYSIHHNLLYSELYSFYKSCDIVSFISTFEGFGMPIVEAQFVERPVITSNISSMPEVAGEGACLVNPFDVTDIRNGFLKVINDDNYREFLIEKGRENRKRFNTQTIAMQYYHLYEKMYKEIIA